EAVPLVSGPARVTLVDDGTTLVFQRETRTLLTFAARDFQIGTVDDLDSGASFDPYWLFVDNPLEPVGFAWHEVDKLGVVASSPQGMTLSLDYDGGSGTLELTAGAPGNVTVVFKGRSGGDPVAYLRVRPTVDGS